MRQILSIVFSAIMLSCVYRQEPQYNAPGMGNPLVPGYFADPTIKKFGDMYYLYATTDGIKLASGEPQVWISKDFVNWYNYEMEIDLPPGLTNCWAPDVLKGKDGKYYYFMGNCQFGCNIYGYVSDSPMGPWKPLNEGKPVIPVGTGKEHLPALDAQFVQTEEGEMIAFFGTWCTLFGGLGWAKLDPETMRIHDEGYIPLEQLPEIFEAPYALEREGRWFMMYSSGDCRLSDYAVHYAWADSIYGPYRYGENNPILSSSEDGTIDSPGHNSVIEENGEYYILYHRHDNPHSSGGEFRQVCADRLIFSDAYTIGKIEPSHTGIGYLAKNSIPYKNRALKAKTHASSYYHLLSPPTRFEKNGVDHAYLPEYATDDNNGTLWKSGSSTLPQSLTIDLGKTTRIRRIMTQFEYPTFYYQYQWEVSVDSINWFLFSDKRSNRRSGSPMIDDGDADARYVRITVTGTEKTGMYAAIWNVKVYDHLFEIPSFSNNEMAEGPGEVGERRLLVDLDVRDLTVGKINGSIPNQGELGGGFTPVGEPLLTVTDNVKSISLDGESYLLLTKPAPKTLDWNAPFTVSAWVYNPEIKYGECVVSWNSRRNMLQASYAAMMYGTGPYGAMAHGDGYVDVAFNEVPEAGKWHHLAVTFDGMCEYIYVNGQLDRQLPLMLFVEAEQIRIGASGEISENFTGSIAGVRLYDGFSTVQQIREIMCETDPYDSFYKKYLDAGGIPVVSSEHVSDEALIRAQRVITVMLSKRPDVKRVMVESGCKVMIIGRNEEVCDLPEYAHICDTPENIAYWNKRARGFGGAPEDAFSASFGEENVLCLEGDRYKGESILVHEFAHLIHTVGIVGVDPGFNSELEALRQHAIEKGRWENTYAISNKEEYFAEAVQSFFDCNRYSEKPNGVHNAINTRAKLKVYDPEMYELLLRYFPESDLGLCDDNYTQIQWD